MCNILKNSHKSDFHEVFVCIVVSVVVCLMMWSFLRVGLLYFWKVLILSIKSL
jgi:hypothetical protein